jgi:hypothetical protein
MSIKTHIVNCRDNPHYDVFIGRPSLWGNPFKIGRDGTREEVIEKFRQYLKGQPHLIEIAKEHLKGKVLGCYCKPLHCHGDVWLEVLNEETGNGD